MTTKTVESSMHAINGTVTTLLDYKATWLITEVGILKVNLYQAYTS